MMWIAPAFFAMGALVGLPLLLHLLRRKPRETMRFPSLQFLGATAVRETKKHQIRRWITLLLRCLVILLLAAAFARPFFADEQKATGKAVVIAVDNSMSMQEGSRWDRLKSWALGEMQLLKPGDRAGLLLMHPTPTWLVPIGTDAESVRTALQALPPGFESTRYEPALRMAGQALANLPAEQRTLIWMADEQRSGWAGTNLQKTLPDGVRFKFAEPQRAPMQQTAMGRVTFRREDGAIVLNGSARLLSSGTRKAKVIAEVNGVAAGQTEVQLKSGEETAFTIRLPLKPEDSAQSMAIAVKLPPDLLPADDAYYIVIGGAPKLAVALDSPKSQNDPLRQAFDAMTDLPGGGIALSTFDPAKPAAPGQLIVVREGSFENPASAKAIEDFVKKGGTAWVWTSEAPASSDWLAKLGVKTIGWSDSETARHLRGWEPDHPTLKAFEGDSLLSVLEASFYRGVSLNPPDSAETIARWNTGEPAIASVPIGSGRVLIAGFQPERAATDWVVKASFVPWLHSTVRWLQAAQAARQQWTVGETIPVSGSGQWRTLVSPRQAEPRSVSDVVPAEAPGLFAFEQNGVRSLFAVNVSPIESDLTPWGDAAALANLESKSQETKSTSAIPAELRLSEQDQRLWWWVLAFAGLLLMSELALANRTAP